MLVKDKILCGQVIDALGTVGMPLPRQLSPAAKKKADANRDQFVRALGKLMQAYRVHAIRMFWETNFGSRRPNSPEKLGPGKIVGSIASVQNPNLNGFRERLAVLMHAHEINAVEVYWQRYGQEQ